MEHGMNGPIMAISFFAGMGFSFSGLLTSLLAAILVGVIAKGFDRLTRAWIAERNNYWRREAQRQEREKNALAARLKDLQGAEAAPTE
jgi:hypothetical protein